jgi:hypothetical protein
MAMDSTCTLMDKNSKESSKKDSKKAEACTSIEMDPVIKDNGTTIKRMATAPSPTPTNKSTPGDGSTDKNTVMECMNIKMVINTMGSGSRIKRMVWEFFIIKLAPATMVNG